MIDQQTVLRGVVACGAVLAWMLLPPAAAQEGAPPGTTQALSRTPWVRAICPNYIKALSAAVYPRDAIDRNLNAGEAVVDFVVDEGRARQITVVSESDPAFGAMAAAIVARLECEHVEQPIHFRPPFKFRR